MRLAARLLSACLFLVAACTGRPANLGGPVPDGEQVSRESNRLPASGFSVAWTRPQVPARLSPDQIVSIPVTLKNTSDRTWPDSTMADPSHSAAGAYSVRLSYRMSGTGGNASQGSYDARVELGRPLPPGESVTLVILVKAPAERGKYQLQFDLVQELYAWFADKGADRLLVPVEIR